MPSTISSVPLRPPETLFAFFAKRVGKFNFFGRSTSQFLQEFLLVQPVFERLAPVYEHDWDFVGELALEAVVGFDVYFAPLKAASAF